LEFSKMHLKDHDKLDSLVWRNQDLTIQPECQASRLAETWHHPYCEAWWWQHHAVGMFFSGRDRETRQDQWKDERILWMSLSGTARARTWTWSNISGDLKKAARRHSSNRTELERICREWEKLRKYRCAKLVPYTQKGEAVIAAKGDSTKYWVNGLNTSVLHLFY
jgi:hypothetical protein